jgi:hypothetical protein
MGSGISGSYFGTRGAEQSYSKLYSVASDMLKIDRQDLDIYSPKTGYFKNPTATDLLESVKDNKVLYRMKEADGYFMYVLREDGKIIFGKRSNPNNKRKRSPHPTLIGGKKPKVQCAGIIHFIDGKIKSVNNSSGHFRPNDKSLSLLKDKLYREFRELLYKNYLECIDE